MVGDHCRDRGEGGRERERKYPQIKIKPRLIRQLFGIGEAPTDCCKDVGEAEVIHGVKGEEVVEELLLLIVTAEEGVPFVQFSERKDVECFTTCKNNTT